MRQLNYILLLLISITCVSTTFYETAEKIEWKTYDEAVKEAAKKNKLIAIDVYTSWCGYCKVMDQKTFTDPKVIAYMNKKYVAVKLNAEGSNSIHYKNIPLTEREFASRILAVSSYPTISYLSHKEEVISNVPGYMEAPMFKKVLVFFAEDHYKTTQWQERLILF